MAFKNILSYAESEVANDHIYDLTEDNERLRLQNDNFVINLNQSTMNFEIVVN